MIIATVFLPLLAAPAIWLGHLSTPLAFSATFSTLAFGMGFAANFDQDHYSVLTFVTAIGFVWSLVEVVRLWLRGEDKAEGTSHLINASVRLSSSRGEAFRRNF